MCAISRLPSNKPQALSTTQAKQVFGFKLSVNAGLQNSSKSLPLKTQQRGFKPSRPE